MQSINGFEIDKYNQYDLPENVKYSTCPLCSHTRKKKTQKCMTLHWDTGLGVCSHCGEVVQLHTFKSKKKEADVVYVKPKWTNRTQLSDKLVKYFEKRGISQMTLRIMKISEGTEVMHSKRSGKYENMNTVQFPFFRDGEVVDVKYRSGAKDFKLYKDAERIFYNIDSIKYSKEVIICEGEIDCLSFVEAGVMNIVSTPNGSTNGNVNLSYLDRCIEYFEGKEKIYLALDDDEPGRNVSKEFIRRLGANRCYLVTQGWWSEFGVKDSNDYLIKYGKEKLAFTIQQAKVVPIEGVSSVSDWEAEFDNYVANGMQKGYVIGKKSFDNIFSTYTGQYIVVTGKPSSGKSDFVDEMCIGYNRLYGWKTAYASPENKPNVRHVGKLISKLAGQWVNNKNFLHLEWYRQAKNYLNEYFKFIDLKSYDLTEVLDIAKQLILRYGIKILVIDPYNKIRLKKSAGKKTEEYTNDYLLLIDEFAREHDVLVILVAHPVKPSSEERKSYEPDFYSIKGGGEFYDMSPHGLLVHRDYDNDLVKVKVLKVKFSHLGENNAHIWLRWNKNSGRYVDFENQDAKALNVSKPVYDDSNWFIQREKNAEQSSIDFSPVKTPEELEADFIADVTPESDLPF